MRSDHVVSLVEKVGSGHNCVLTKVGISLVGEPIASLVEEPNGGLAMESYVGHHLQQRVSHQLAQTKLWVNSKSRKVVSQMILTECGFWHLLDEIWLIGKLLHGIGSFKLE